MGRIEIAGECVELPLPEHALVGDPRRSFLERTGHETEDVAPPLAAAFEESRALEHSQVSRDGGKRDVHRFGEYARRRGVAREPGEKRAARGIGECGKRGVERRLVIINHMVNNRGCARRRKRKRIMAFGYR